MKRYSAHRVYLRYRLCEGLLILLIILQATMANSGEVKPGWQLEWERTLEAAKKEGRVTIYISGWHAVLDAGVFQRRYPEIKVVAVTGRGPDIGHRILAERRAGKYLADVISQGIPYPYPILYQAKALDPIKPALILPEVTDESKWWGGKHHYADPTGQYAFVYVGNPDMGSVAYNSKLVNPLEIKSLWDLVDPRWRGRMEVRDIISSPGVGSSAIRFFYYNPNLGPKFIKRLFGEMNVALFRDSRLGTDWLATAKFSICFFCMYVPETKNQGLPVDQFGLLKEGAGLGSSNGVVALLNKAPYPNAAKVLINWFLSPEGQSTLQKSIAKAGGNAPNSRRIDIPKDEVLPQSRLSAGIKYLDLETPERVDMEPVLGVFKEALAQSEKR